MLECRLKIDTVWKLVPKFPMENYHLNTVTVWIPPDIRYSILTVFGTLASYNQSKGHIYIFISSMPARYSDNLFKIWRAWHPCQVWPYKYQPFRVFKKFLLRDEHVCAPSQWLEKPRISFGLASAMCPSILSYNVSVKLKLSRK